MKYGYIMTKGRANSFNFAHSDEMQHIQMKHLLIFTTPEAADGSPVWGKKLIEL